MAHDELDEDVVAAYEGFNTSLKCEPCKLTWPPVDEFIRCPGCGNPTEIQAVKPVGYKVVNARLKGYAEKAQWAVKQLHSDFEAYYLKRELAILNEDLGYWPHAAPEHEAAQ